MADTETRDGLKWSDEERRKAERRSGKDQREMIRFELDKDDRRSGTDRRSDATSWGTDDPV